MLVVVEIERKDIKKDLYHFLKLLFVDEYEYFVYDSEGQLSDEIEKHVDKKADDNFICIIDLKKKELKIQNIVANVRVVDVDG
jgi:hypothetical protein